MFTDISGQLAKGVMPDKKVLARRLDAALTKKLGVLQIPYLCQPTDPKINPPVRQLLLAAVLLGDAEKIQLVLDILQTEMGQQNRSPSRQEVRLAVAEALQAAGRLLAAFPEELGHFRKIMADLDGKHPEGI